jgi:UDP-3-O-[3-hydroxymyristoyl] glucosamine N-acyltransferase
MQLNKKKMKKIDIIILGAGNPDIIKLIEDINDYKSTYNLIGFLEKDESLFGKKIGGYEIIGSDELLISKFSSCAVVNNVAKDTKIRGSFSDKIQTMFGKLNFPNLIHPSINIKHLNFGIGNIIYENTSLGADVKIGDFNLIFFGCILGHQTNIGNKNILGANVTIGSRCTISDRVQLSNSCTISNSLSICDDVFVGVGSVVLRSISKPMKVFGNPAREMLI